MVSEGAERGRAAQRGRGEARRAPRHGAGVRGVRPLADVPQQRLQRPGHRPVRTRGSRTISPTTGCRWAGSSRAPRAFTLADLRTLPSRTQITRHDCVEGLERHREVEGHAARRAARRREAEAGSALRDVLLRRPDGERRHELLLREHRPRRRAPSADDPRVRHERRAAAGARTARRSACASSGSWATSTRSSSRRSSSSRASRTSRAGRAATGRTRGTSGGRGSSCDFYEGCSPGLNPRAPPLNPLWSRLHAPARR